VALNITIIIISKVQDISITINLLYLPTQN